MTETVKKHERSDCSIQGEENITESAPQGDYSKKELAVAKRNRYTFEEKKQILEECKTLNSRELCVKYGINKSVLSKWRSNEEIIKDAAQTSHTKTLKKVSETNELDAELFTWLSDCRCKGIPVSGPMLCRQALVINSRIGGPENFKASHGWLEKWKRRTDIKNLMITGIPSPRIMEAMDLDGDAVVDLSVSSNTRRDSPSVPTTTPTEMGAPLDLGIHFPSSNIENNVPEARNIQNATRGILAPKTGEDRRPRRNLRPRTERSYAEVPEEPRLNGYLNGNASDSDEGEMPPLLPIKELSSDELAERERTLRKLREELRSEEMKLVLLKKLRQSQQLKENIAAVAKIPTKLPPPVTVQQTSHSHRSAKAPPPSLRGQPAPSRSSSSSHAPPPGMLLPPTAGRSSTSSTGMPPNMVIPQPPHPRSRPIAGTTNVSYHAPADRTERSTKDPTPVPAHQDRPREDTQSPAQRQAAAKLALRKQLEKTLLQIPPPKPPPPEMHFVPNPSNTEFIYLVGLEHVVDFITKEPAIPPPPEPFECTQCKTDFTPVWKWEKVNSGKKDGGPRGQHATFQRPPAGRDPRVICEHCVTTNVKKALKAEHTNRLKTAFVKALQQEQEMEQRLAQAACPSPDPPPPKPVPKAVTPTRRVATPPAPPPVPQAPPPAPTPPAPKLQEHPLVKLAESGKFSPHHAAAAAALQQQLLRELTKNPVPGLPPHQPLPAHMMPPFNPILYPYQLAMAQAAGGKGLVELQRQAADLQRQYLLDMIPSQASQGQGSQASSRAHPHNWKT